MSTLCSYRSRLINRMNHEGSMPSLLPSRTVRRKWDGLLECPQISRSKACPPRGRRRRESLYSERGRKLIIRPSPSASSSAASGQAIATSSRSASVPTGAFDVENPSSTVSDTAASATDTPNGAGQTTVSGYAGVAAIVMGVYAIL